MRASLYLYVVHYMNSDVIGKSDILSFYFSMCAHVISMVGMFWKGFDSSGTPQ